MGDAILDCIVFTLHGSLPKTLEGRQRTMFAGFTRRHGSFEPDYPANLAVIAKCGTLARRRFDACHRSYWACIPIHSSGLVPSASESRKAISADIPALPLRMRDRAARVTPKCLAASVTDTPPR